MIERREKVNRDFEDFLSNLVRDLNDKSEDGWTLLVEGLRDDRAMRKLGYIGPLITFSLLTRRGSTALKGIRKVVILTDLDREGRALASKCMKTFVHEGIESSLGERRRLKAASRGVFLHIEDLARFAIDSALPLTTLTEPAGSNKPTQIPDPRFSQSAQFFRE